MLNFQVNEEKLTWHLAESSWEAEEIAAAIAVLSSGRITMGERVAEFERAFAERLGVRYAIMTNSGSSANLLAVSALSHMSSLPGLEPGDEAIVPALAWATTYAPLAQHGVKLRLIDVNLETLNAEFPAYEAALEHGTALLVAVNILGNPCESIPQLRKLCDQRGCYLLEDNCESLGAEIHGYPAGTLAHVATHSFFFSHQLSTGEGGMLTTDDREIADLARCLRAHGWARDLEYDSPLFERFGRAKDFQEAYRFLLPGYNLRPTEIAAAIGLVQLKRLDHLIAERRKNAARFRAAFGGDERFQLQRETGSSSWFGFTMVLREHWATGKCRSAAFGALRDTGIEFRPITGGDFTQHPAARSYHWEIDDSAKLANVGHLQGFGWFVGNHARDLSAEISLLKNALSTI